MRPKNRVVSAREAPVRQNNSIVRLFYPNVRPAEAPVTPRNSIVRPGNPIARPRNYIVSQKNFIVSENNGCASGIGTDASDY